MSQRDPLIRLSAHGQAAIGATVLEVRRGGEPIGKVRRMSGSKVWEWQPKGWVGWTGDYKLMRDAIAALDSATTPVGDSRVL